MIVLKRIGTISGERSKREINRAWFATRTALTDDKGSSGRSHEAAESDEIVVDDEVHREDDNVEAHGEE